MSHFCHHLTIIVLLSFLRWIEIHIYWILYNEQDSTVEIINQKGKGEGR